jgi:hypothetical protein
MQKEELKEIIKEEIDKTEFICNKLQMMSKKEFKSFLKSIDELDIWEEAVEEGLDVFNNVDERIEVIDVGFDEEDIERYYKALNK